MNSAFPNTRLNHFQRSFSRRKDQALLFLSIILRHIIWEINLYLVIVLIILINTSRRLLLIFIKDPFLHSRRIRPRKLIKLRRTLIYRGKPRMAPLRSFIIHQVRDLSLLEFCCHSNLLFVNVFVDRVPMDLPSFADPISVKRLGLEVVNRARVESGLIVPCF